MAEAQKGAASAGKQVHRRGHEKDRVPAAGRLSQHIPQRDEQRCGPLIAARQARFQDGTATRYIFRVPAVPRIISYARR
jgi:hypothetical protein